MSNKVSTANTIAHEYLYDKPDFSTSYNVYDFKYYLNSILDDAYGRFEETKLLYTTHTIREGFIDEFSEKTGYIITVFGKHPEGERDE